MPGHLYDVLFPHILAHLLDGPDHVYHSCSMVLHNPRLLDFILKGQFDESVDFFRRISTDIFYNLHNLQFYPLTCEKKSILMKLSFQYKPLITWFYCSLSFFIKDHVSRKTHVCLPRQLHNIPGHVAE